MSLFIRPLDFEGGTWHEALSKRLDWEIACFSTKSGLPIDQIERELIAFHRSRGGSAMSAWREYRAAAPASAGGGW